MMFLFRKYKKIMIFLVYVHNSKMTYIKKRMRYQKILSKKKKLNRDNNELCNGRHHIPKR